DHPTLDDYWKELRLDDAFAHIDVPVLHITGWFDADQPGALFFHEGMRDKANQSLLIGPWDHQGTRIPRQVTAGVDFGPAAVVDVRDEHRAWFDRHLKGIDAPAARARVFLTGENAWYESASWPPPSTVDVRWY